MPAADRRRGPAPAPQIDQERAYRPPRLNAEFRALRALDANLEDWRRLDPDEVSRRFRGGGETLEDRTLLATAVFAGTAQACMQGSYWSPSFNCPGCVKVACQHVARPISAFYHPDKVPKVGALMPAGRQGALTCAARCSPLDAAVRFAAAAESSSVAVLRFTSVRDIRNTAARYCHPREDQIFLRTTYSQAFERMEADINSDVGVAIDTGGVVVTSGVGILRGPLEEGALWFQEPPKVDVLWVGLPPHPQLGAEEQYHFERDRCVVSRTLDLAFAWAAAHGNDALVMPPIGCGSHGCAHPRLDVAEIIHTTAARYARYIPHICVASDLPQHCEGGWWEEFAEAVQHGRQPPQDRPAVPPICIPPQLRVKKDPTAMMEKTLKLDGRTPRQLSLTGGKTPRQLSSTGGKTPRRLTFL